MAAPITSEVIAEEARRLSVGGYRPTPRQLYYAVCAAVERPSASTAPALMGSGVILILVGAILIPVHFLPLTGLLVGLGVALMVVAGLNRRAERRRPPGPRTLAVSFDSFISDHLPKARAAIPGDLACLVDPATRRPDRRLAAVAVVVVCDREETVAMIAANTDRGPGGLVAVEESVLGERARGRRLLALHDADPRGCELPARLRDAGAAEVTDLGLLPPADDAGLQVIEGAPARLPRDLGADLSPDQISWLRSGRRLELATRTPEQVVAQLRLTAPAIAVKEPTGPEVPRGG